MLVAIHQPEYLAWLGYFEKMMRADVFVLLDNVQFSKGNFHNRTRIKGVGGVQWLSIPVHGSISAKINEVRVAGHKWEMKHWHSLVSCYSRAAFFEVLKGVFEAIYRQSAERMLDYNLQALELIAGVLGIEKNWVLASEINAGGKKSDLVLNICRELGATAYYSGRSGSTYLRKDDFDQAGIKIEVQNFAHPVYEQLFGGFTPNLSVLDLLFNCGPSASRDLIRDAGLHQL